MAVVIAGTAAGPLATAEYAGVVACSVYVTPLDQTIECDPFTPLIVPVTSWLLIVTVLPVTVYVNAVLLEPTQPFCARVKSGPVVAVYVPAISAQA
jgi:hypothetical protein